MPLSEGGCSISTYRTLSHRLACQDAVSLGRYSVPSIFPIPYTTDFLVNFWRSFLLQLTLSTLNLSYPPIQLHTGVPSVRRGSNSQIYCLRRCAHRTGATRTDLLYLVVRNCLHAQSKLEIWSAIILLAYMMRYVYRCISLANSPLRKNALIVYLI
jgi:hypothetical protein